MFRCLHCSGIVAVGSSLSLHTGAAMLPHSEKANKAGEDAFFISECGLYFGAPPGLRAGLGDQEYGLAAIVETVPWIAVRNMCGNFLTMLFLSISTVSPGSINAWLFMGII